ncbi:MAG: RNA pyrophosphohydrolase [Rhodospirillales bacterium]|nr:RNA pyrophosphohydrolase [Rhodospirillales bacterium]
MKNELKKEKLPYRPCAGAMLINNEGKVFVARRIDTPGNAWQMPQGGIDDGEDTSKAVLRELREETGIDKVEIIAESANWRNYDLPKDLIGKLWGGKYRGQRQKWFLIRFLGVDKDINLEAHGSPEFSDWRWVGIDEIVDLIVPFKQTLYADIVAEFRTLVEGSR